MIKVETERLILREYTEADWQLMVHTFNEPDFIKFVADKGIRSREDALQRMQEVEFACYQRDGFGSWLIQLKTSGEAIGSCGVFKREPDSPVELGYALRSNFYGRGYGLEAAQGVINWAKENINCDKVVATTSPEHHSSIKLLTKLGFTYLGVFEEDNYGLSNFFEYLFSPKNKHNTSEQS
jgi:RimJ/RimL family protein N-acetyltransferase